MSDITLAQADSIADAALAKGRELGLEPLTVLVLDRGGHVVVGKRADDSGILRYQLALAKAYGALGFGAGSRSLAVRAGKAPHFMAAAAAVAEGRLAPAPGGVLIRDESGRVIGAVGISGDSGDNDETCAAHAITSVSLRPDTGA